MNIIKNKKRLNNPNDSYGQATDSNYNGSIKGIENTRDQMHYRKQLMLKVFEQMIPFVAHEDRYGFAFNKVEDYEYIKELFASLSKNYFIFKSLINLKNWNLDSFLHALDVFILANLFVKRYQNGEMKEFALATLLLDIGKVHIPKYILQKKILTSNERNLYNEHHLWSYKMLGNRFSDYVNTVVLNHSISLSGNQIFEKKIQQSILIISVIDMYSSLTRNKKDKKTLNTPRALETMIKNTNNDSRRIVTNLMDLVHIYPNNSNVLLSNGAKAKIKNTNVNTPFLPYVSEYNTGNHYRLPLNQSILVNRYLSWEGDKTKKKGWKELIDLTAVKDQSQAYQIFIKSIQGEYPDHVYINIVVPAMKELLENGKDPYMLEKFYLKWMWENFSAEEFI